MRRDNKESPPVPVNVKLVWRNGTTQPLDCRYIGIRHGVHMWQAIVNTPVDPREARLTCDELPAHCGIEITIEPPSITCPRCNMTSYSPGDIEHNYCGNCHWWTSDPQLATIDLTDPPTDRRDTMLRQMRWLWTWLIAGELILSAILITQGYWIASIGPSVAVLVLAWSRWMLSAPGQRWLRHLRGIE